MFASKVFVFPCNIKKFELSVHLKKNFGLNNSFKKLHLTNQFLYEWGRGWGLSFSFTSKLDAALVVVLKS
jgi:hypothetical protein